MNLLTDKPPEHLIIDGEKYEIRTDFKVWIRLTQECFLQEITPLSISKALCMVYKQIPPDPEKAIAAMFDFYTGGRDNKQQKNAEQATRKKMIFDFDGDAWLIFSSFFEEYHINLTKADLHWWVFRCLFDGLSQETAFGKALHFRSVDLSQIKDKEQRKYYSKMKKLYELPDNRTEEEKEKDFAEDFGMIF